MLPEIDRDRLSVRSIVLAGVIGVVAVPALFWASLVAAPATTLFGEQNSVVTRAFGAAAGMACGPSLLAGPLLYGWARRRPQVTNAATLAAMLVSFVVAGLTW